MDIAPKNLGMLGTFLYETSIEYKIYYQHTWCSNKSRNEFADDKVA